MTVPLPPLTFRWKILLGMMLVVTSVAGAAQLVTQRAVDASTTKLFHERFRSEVEYFSAARQARLAAARDKCLELSRSVRLLAALQEHETDILYKIAFDELRDVVSSEATLAAARPATFFRIFDVDGRVLPPADARAGLMAAAQGGEWERTLSTAIRAMPPKDAQSFGYVPVDGDELNEVVLTRIIDPIERRAVGGLAIGFPLPGTGTGASGGPLQGALWVARRLHSPNLDESVSREIAAALAGAAGDEMDVRLGGVPHRLLKHALAVGPGFPPAEEISVYSLADALAERARLRRSIAAAGALGLVLALVFSLALSRGLSVPIEDLVAASAEVRRGNFTIEVPVRSADEIGRLAASFNEMVAGLKMKEKYRNYLDLLTDKEIAAELSAGKAPTGGEIREVSVLFCDIRGFTAMTEKMHPGEVIDLLNEQMTELTAVVYEHHGVVDKFVGDQIMAQFGAPKSHGNDALNAVRCAMGMIAARRRLNGTSRYHVEVGIGVASGQAVAGWMGSSNRLMYTVLGERVNLASRLCAKAGRMEILIDETTQAKVAPAFTVEPLPAMELKGFSAPMPAYRIAAARASEANA